MYICPYIAWKWTEYGSAQYHVSVFGRAEAGRRSITRKYTLETGERP